MPFYRNRVFIRALNKNDQPDRVDVMDLDDESFRAFVLDALIREGLVYSIAPETPKDEIILREKKGSNGRD